jgi:hypothetical protein
MPGFARRNWSWWFGRRNDAILETWECDRLPFDNEKIVVF